MFVLAYLLGSISSAILVSRLFKLPDPRTHGSNNPGATNVYRLGGSLPACLVLVFDILKGTIPVWGAYFLKLEPLELGLIAVAACLGHMYPLLIGTWLLIVAITRYSSLAALVAVTLAPLYTWWIKPLYTLPVTFITLLIIIRHRTNIVRLFKGEEPKVGTKQAPTDDKK